MVDCCDWGLRKGESSEWVEWDEFRGMVVVVVAECAELRKYDGGGGEAG